MNLFSTQWAHHVKSTSIRSGYYVDRSRVKFRRISTSFPRTFFRCNFDGRKIHVVSTYFFDVISLVEKSASFPRTFFDVISMVKKSMLFPRTLFDVISMVEISTLFLLTFFDVIWMGKNSISFLVTCDFCKILFKFFK